VDGPLDPRRLREIRKWLEGSRPDDPTAEEIREFEAWVGDALERALARNAPTRDLLELLNAAREELRRRRDAGES
jgi:hypothetical protein